MKKCERLAKEHINIAHGHRQQLGDGLQEGSPGPGFRETKEGGMRTY